MYGSKRKGEALELLYELAMMTGVSRRDEAWAKIKENFKSRKATTGEHKALTTGDVKFALGYFRNLPQDKGEPSDTVSGETSSTALTDSEIEGLEKLERVVPLAEGKEHED